MCWGLRPAAGGAISVLKNRCQALRNSQCQAEACWLISGRSGAPLACCGGSRPRKASDKAHLRSLRGVSPACEFSSALSVRVNNAPWGN